MNKKCFNVLGVLAIVTINKPQSQNKENDNSNTLKDNFSSRTDPSTLTIAPQLPEQSNETSSAFLELKSTNHLLPQSTVSWRSDSMSEANSSYCYKSEAQTNTEWIAVLSTQTPILHITSLGRSIVCHRKNRNKIGVLRSTCINRKL